MNAIRLLSLVLTLSLSGIAAAAADSHDNPAALQAGEQQLQSGRTSLDEKTLLEARSIFEQCLRQNQNERCAYDLASSDSYLAQAKEAHKDNKAAEHWLDSGIEDAKRAIAMNGRSSDAHALLADLYGRKIGFGGMFAGMHYGPKATAETQRAFELDPNNPRAYAVIGRKYLFAPKMFGGDPQKAIESFQKATSLDPHYDEAFVWLAIAYRKNGKEQEAQTALAEALRLNPQSAFAKQVQSGAKVQ
jgi:tetratricopeptide (TPR) repeat protein